MNRLIKILTIWVTFLLYGCMSHMQLFGQQPNFMFQAKLSSDTILLGDRVELSIKAVVPSEYEVHFPFFADSIAHAIEVVGKPKIDTISSRKSNTKELLYRLPITSFDSGYHRIPGFKLPFYSGELSDTATTASLWLMVNTLPPDTSVTSIYDIKPPISQPYTFAEIAPWVGGAIILLGLIALGVLYYLRRKKDQPLFFPRKALEPPHVIALRELAKLQDANEWNTDNPKRYQSVLTDILRTYIEGRFQIPAMEQTTFEIISRFKGSEQISKKLIAELEQILTLADLVKFAKFITTVDENKESLSFGFRFVNETKIAEETEESTGNEDKNKQQSDKDKLPVEPLNIEEQ